MFSLHDMWLGLKEESAIDECWGVFNVISTLKQRNFGWNFGVIGVDYINSGVFLLQNHNTQDEIGMYFN